MADALVSQLLGQLVSLGQQEIEKELTLVVGVKKDLAKLKITFGVIQAVLQDAEKKQVKNKEVKFWLGKLKDVAYDMDDVLDEWRTNSSMKTVHKNLLSCFFDLKVVVFRHRIGCNIREIRERLDVIANEKNKFSFNLGRRTEVAEEPQRLTSSMIDLSEISGRVHDKSVIVSKLLNECNIEQGMGTILPFATVSIVGMGGLGKTTLAQLVFNDDSVKNSFEQTMWVCVSDPFDKVRVSKAIIEEVEGRVSNIGEWQALHRRLSKSMEGKRFLLVLDDVWTEDPTVWNSLKISLKCGAQGSRIVVTTRNERVAMMMDSAYIHYLGKLSEEECWSLFSCLAFAGRTDQERQMLEGVGKELAKKCKGLPLAAKALGSLMRFKKKKQDWQDMLQSETWVEEGVLPALLLSYYDLPSNFEAVLCILCSVSKRLQHEEG